MNVHELIPQIEQLKRRVESAVAVLRLPEKKKEIAALTDETARPEFWQAPDKAREVSKNLAQLEQLVTTWERLSGDVSDLLSLATLSAQDREDTMGGDIAKRLRELTAQFQGLEDTLLFTGVHDSYPAIVSIHAGTGGTDAQDWAEMLLRMYLRYADRKRFATNIVSINPGGEAGIKKVVIEVSGEGAFGMFKSEAGVHRLVRISPFDAEKMRHTSFALVEVLPDLGELEEIQIKPEELKVEVFRASGHGGQGVNTTDSAVRITHISTGITSICMNERSQYQNKRRAMRYLKAKLKLFYEAEQEEEKKKLRGEFTAIAWGNQARSYVLHPYKLVKDHRTDYETTDVDRVLDGDIDDFVESYLKYRV